jgi:spoIIIJ-associated protein
MEWVETTGKTVDEARDLALDRLGVAEDEAEFEVLDEPKQGLFGRVRGEARVRARVRPTAVRPKQDRRGRARKSRGDDESADRSPVSGDTDTGAPSSGPQQSSGDRRPGGSRHAPSDRPRQRKERTEMGADDNRRDGDEDEQPVDPAAVGEAAVEFMTGLAAALGTPATASLTVEGSELDVQVEGSELGLLIGPGGRTLMAVQDLARVAAQRRLGDHETRLRIDVAGYRERRRQALEKFTAAVANEVIASGRSKALEPMTSADRKVVHDAIQGIDGVVSHSDGEEPRRRVVIAPG